MTKTKGIMIVVGMTFYPASRLRSIEIKKKNKKKKPVSPSTYISGFLGAGVSVYSFRSFSSSGTMNSMSGATRTLQSATGCLNHAISKTSKTRVVFGRVHRYAFGDVLFRWESVSDFKNRRRNVRKLQRVYVDVFFAISERNIWNLDNLYEEF